MNKKKVLIIVGIVLALFVIGVCTYLVLDKSNKVVDDENKANMEEKKDNNQKEEPKDEPEDDSEDEDIDDLSLVTKLMDAFNPKNICNTDYYQIIYGNDRVYYDDLVNEKGIDYRYSIVNSYTNKDIDNGPDFGYKVSNYDKNYYKIFGYDKEIKLKNISKKTPDSDKIFTGYQYYMMYKDGDYYRAEFRGGGSGYTEINNYKIFNIIEKDDCIEVYIKHILAYGSVLDPEVFIDGMMKKLKIYPLVVNDNPIAIIDCDGDCYNTDISKYIDEYKDQLDTYKYTFKYDKEHENYYFYSIEKVN